MLETQNVASLHDKKQHSRALICSTKIFCIFYESQAIKKRYFRLYSSTCPDFTIFGVQYKIGTPLENQRFILHTMSTLPPILKKTVALIFSIFFVTIAGLNLQAQSFRKDRLTVPTLSANVGFCLPMGDLKDRYNIFGQAGSSFMMKFKNNTLLAAEGLVLFGEGYKGEDPLRLIVNSNGTLTNQYGQPAEFARGMRGVQITAKAGYIFSRFAHNPNSGFTFTAGAGFFQSKYWIDQRGNNVPQIMGEYVKGYDKMSNGFALTQFVGYTYFHNKNFWNVFVGIEFTEAWTQNRREWDFTLMRKDDRSYREFMTAFKAGWILSFIRREAEDVYYY
jgi:hypothetical protein